MVENCDSKKHEDDKDCNHCYDLRSKVDDDYFNKVLSPVSKVAHFSKILDKPSPSQPGLKKL